MAPGPEGVRRKFKVCLVGDKTSNKTALIRRFVLDAFDDAYVVTVGTKVSAKQLRVRNPRGGPDIDVDMTIWDIMGQKGFLELFKEAYFYGAKGILAVCDSTRKKTLEDLDDWIDSVFQVAGPIPVVLLANRPVDATQLQVTDDDLKAASLRFGGQYYWVSASTGENVETAFRAIADQILAREPAPNRASS